MFSLYNCILHKVIDGNYIYYKLQCQSFILMQRNPLGFWYMHVRIQTYSGWTCRPYTCRPSIVTGWRSPAAFPLWRRLHLCAVWPWRPRTVSLWPAFCTGHSSGCSRYGLLAVVSSSDWLLVLWGEEWDHLDDECVVRVLEQEIGLGQGLPKPLHQRNVPALEIPRGTVAIVARAIWRAGDDWNYFLLVVRRMICCLASSTSNLYVS